MRLRRLLLLVCVAMLSIGCGRHAGRVTIPQSAVVLAFGDSLTAGTGARTSESYPKVLEGLIGCQVINAGVPGEDSTAGIKRLKGLLQAKRVDLVILCIGGNDMLQGQRDEILRQNIDTMVRMVKTAGIGVILLAVPRPGLRLQPPPLYAAIAEAHGIPCDTDTLARILSAPGLKSDPIHPNARGYRQLAEAVASRIRVQ